MLDSACRWITVENTNYFKAILNIFEFSNVKAIVEP